METKTKTYQVIEESNVVNMNNETLSTLKKGDTVTGELVLIADKTGEEQPFVELEDGKVVSAKGLAEQLTEDPGEKIENQVRGSNKKIIYSLIGAGVGFGIAHYMKRSTKQKIMFTVGGLVLGLGVEYMISKKK